MNDELINRVRMLESQLRWQRRCLALLVSVSVLIVVGVAAGPSTALRAQSLTLVDDDGKTRIVISVLKSGLAGIRMYSPDGKIDASIAGSNGKIEPSVLMYTRKDGKAVVGASMSINEGEPRLGIEDKDGKATAELLMLEGKASLVITDKTGKQTFSAP
jgi:hypothetical protein